MNNILELITISSESFQRNMLSLDADAKLRAITDVAPSGQDEMSINDIKRQWNHLNVGFIAKMSIPYKVDEIETRDFGNSFMSVSTSSLFIHTRQIITLGTLLTLCYVFRSSVSAFTKFLVERVNHLLASVVSLFFSTCYRFGLSFFALWNVRMR